MSLRIKLFAPACAALAFLGGCAVYPDGSPAYGGPAYGGQAYGGDYYGYGGGPAVIQPEVAIGIGGYSGSGYYDQRRGYGPGYHGQSNWGEHSRPDHGEHPHAGDGGPHGAPQGGGPGGHPGGTPPQAGSNGGQHGGGYGGGNSRGSGGGNNRAEGYGYGQHSSQH
jgi:hypothetical protein